MKNLKDYLTVKDFMRRSMKSEKTVRRLITKERESVNASGAKLVKLENRKWYLHKELLNHFVSDYYLMMEQNRLITRENKPVNEYAEFFDQMEWTWYGHISYEKSYPELACRSIMTRFFERLICKFPDRQFRMLFVTEHNPSGSGHHNHYVLFCSGGSSQRVKQYADSYFRKNRIAITQIEPYRKELHGVNYITKELKLVTDGWDILP